MGYRFQSEFLYDKMINRELILGAEDSHRLSMLMNLILIGLLVWLFGFTVLVHSLGEVFSQAMILLGLFFLVLRLLKALARLRGGIHYRRALTLNCGEIPTYCVQFWDSYVLDITKGGAAQRQLSYDQFRSVIETKNLYLLTMKHHIFLMVDKRTLSGDPDQFLEFLFFKCDNIRRKRVRSVVPGKLIRILKYLVIAGLLITAMLLHPRLDLENRLASRIHNGMSGRQIVETLEMAGIHGLNSEEAETTARLWEMDFLVDNSKLSDVLYYPALGTWDEEQERMVPGPINYGFTYYWADEEESMYSQLLRKLDSMCDDIFIGEIQENQMLSEGDIVTGHARFIFDLNGTAYTIDAEYDYDIYDPDVFGALSAILEEETGKRLWFRDYQEFGTWLFLGTNQWAADFEALTGWTLSDDFQEVCPDYYFSS